MDRDSERYQNKRPSTGGSGTPNKKQRTNHGHCNDGNHQHHHGPGQRQNGSSQSLSHQNNPIIKKYSTPIIHQSSSPSTPLDSKDLPPLPPISTEYQSPVFTHPSLGTQELSGGPMLCYDKLEFLGDAYIEIIATRLLWSLSDAKLTAARMSSIREGMVKNETLSEYAIAYGMDKKLDIPEASRPLRRDGQVKINGDVFEAYVAAVVLSDPRESSNGAPSIIKFTPAIGSAPGYATAEAWLSALWTSTGKLQTVSTMDDEQSKGLLQQKLGGKGVMINYVQERERIVHKGKGVEQYFMGVYLTGWGYDNQHLGSGEGLSKKAAGMAAAKDAMVKSKDIIAKIEERKAKEKKELEETKEKDQ